MAEEMKVTIRPYDGTTPADIAAVTAIYAYHVLNGRASFEHVPPTQAEMQDRFDAMEQAGYPILIALSAGQIVGYAYAGPHKARKGYDGTVEDSVYVAKEALRRGIGRLLLKELIDVARASGYQQMMAVIGDSANAASIGLHAALGFEMIGTAKGIGYKFGTYLDVTYMQKALQQ